MSMFVLDTTGDKSLIEGKQGSANTITYGKDGFGLLGESMQSKLAAASVHTKEIVSDDDDDDDFFGLPPPTVDITKIINSTLTVTKECESQTSLKLHETNEKVDEAIRNAATASTHKNQKRYKRGRVVDIDYSDINTRSGKFDVSSIDVNNVAQQLIATKRDVCLEKIKELPKYSLHKQRQQKRFASSKTKGSAWYNLPATEVTDDVHNELKVVQMRSVLDPKHFYKKNDLKVLPKYFQLGTVLHSPLDHYNERKTRKTKKSLVDQLLEDEAFQKFNKRKYKEVIVRTNKYAHRKNMKKMKKLKKNKK